MVGFFGSQQFFIGWLVTGSISFAVLVGMFLFFGKLMFLQARIWLLAKRGFHMVEHVGLDRVRSYFYMRPKDNKFDFLHGFYLQDKDASTKITSGIIPPIGKLIRVGDLDKRDSLAFEEKVNKWIYKPDVVTLRWGIPVITYVGNNPHPVNYFDLHGKKSAQLIADMYIRLLATQRYKDMKMMMLIGVCALGLIALGLFLLYKGQASANDIAGMCVANWNATQGQLVQCINMTARAAGQNATVIL